MGDQCQIVAVCDINEEEVNNRIGMYEGAKGFLRYQELLDNPDVDMVDIIVPHVLHYEIAKAALLKGKHVLVEKPITVKSEQGQELIDLAKKAGLKFSVAENTHFVTAYLKAEDGGGYTLEYRIPYATMGLKRAPKANDLLASCFAVFWSRPDGLETAGGAAWALTSSRN